MAAGDNHVTEVDLLAEDVQLRKAVANFLSDLDRVQKKVACIGLESNKLAQNFDAKTSQTMRDIDRMLKTQATYDRLLDRERGGGLKANENVRIQRQLNAERIRGIRDVAVLEKMTDVENAKRDATAAKLALLPLAPRDRCRYPRTRRSGT